LLPHFSTKGGNPAFHDGRFFSDTKPLQTLAETRAGGLLVKYVLLTNAKKRGFFNLKEHKDHKDPPDFLKQGTLFGIASAMARADAVRLLICQNHREQSWLAD
jgi:hypothetical protein